MTTCQNKNWLILFIVVACLSRSQFKPTSRTINHLIKSKLDNNFIEPKLVQQGDNNMLTRQLVQNQFVSLHSVQSNDVSINLITCVDFLGIVYPKSCVILQAYQFPFLSHSTKNQHVFWNVFLFFHFGFPYIPYYIKMR
jgi:hypothetical protein